MFINGLNNIVTTTSLQQGKFLRYIRRHSVYIVYFMAIPMVTHCCNCFLAIKAVLVMFSPTIGFYLTTKVILHYNNQVTY